MTRSAHHRIPKGPTLDVTCWCESTIVAVPVADVAKGITRHCGLAACRRIADQHRRAS